MYLPTSEKESLNRERFQRMIEIILMQKATASYDVILAMAEKMAVVLGDYYLVTCDLEEVSKDIAQRYEISGLLEK